MGHERGGSTIWWLVGAGLAMLALTLPRMFQPLTPDEMYQFSAAASWLTDGRALSYRGGGILATSPYLYISGLAAAFHAFGISEMVARGFGALSGIMTILLAWSLGRRLSGERGGLLAAWAVALTPAFCQGWTMIDIDMTVLVPAVLAVVLATLRWLDTPSAGAGALMAMTMGVMLWCRVTTPWLVVAAAAAGPFFLYPMDERRQGAWRPALAGVLGFGVTWGLFAWVHGIPAAGPFSYLGIEAAVRLPRMAHVSGGSFAADQGAVVLWYGPLVLLWGTALWHRIVSRRGDLFGLLDGTGVLAIVLFVMAGLFGPTFGFPKYHAPGAALLTVVSMAVLADRLPRLIWLLTGIWAGVIIQGVFLGDELYLFRYVLREAATGSAWARGYLAMCLPLVLAGGAAAGAALILLRRVSGGVVAVLLALMLGMNACHAFTQAVAQYQTGYSYGARGTQETAFLVKRQVDSSRRVLATDDIMYYLSRPGQELVPQSLWSRKEQLAVALQDPRTGAVVASVTTQTLEQVRLLRQEPAITALLANGYDHHRIGTYDIWIRRGVKGM